MYFTVTNTKIVRKLSFSLKFSKPKSKNAEKPSFGQKYRKLTFS